jgi:basic membrane protein A and related proteins
MTSRMISSRRRLTAAAALTLGALCAQGSALAQAAAPATKMKVAAIYTVPFEQQWVSRIHKALKAAEARGEIEYKATEKVANAATRSWWANPSPWKPQPAKWPKISRKSAS